jgi:hypothetical protein
MLNHIVIFSTVLTTLCPSFWNTTSSCAPHSLPTTIKLIKGNCDGVVKSAHKKAVTQTTLVIIASNRH